MTTTIPASGSLEWHKQPCFRLVGFLRKPPVWVSATFLRSNPLRLFYKLFGGEWNEPYHEDYTLPDGRIVKVYPLDMHDDLIPGLLGLMWQTPTGYLDSDRDHYAIDNAYTDLVTRQMCMTLAGWKRLLCYYGFIEEKGPHDEISQ